MDAKETSSVLFFAEAVAASPSRAKDLVARARVASTASPSFTEVLTSVEAVLSPQSVDDILAGLEGKSGAGIDVFARALKDAQVRRALSRRNSATLRGHAE